MTEQQVKDARDIWQKELDAEHEVDIQELYAFRAADLEKQWQQASTSSHEAYVVAEQVYRGEFNQRLTEPIVRDTTIAVEGIMRH